MKKCPECVTDTLFHYLTLFHGKRVVVREQRLHVQLQLYLAKTYKWPTARVERKRFVRATFAQWGVSNTRVSRFGLFHPDLSFLVMFRTIPIRRDVADWSLF